MAIYCLTYEDGELWLDGVKKRKIDKDIIDKMNRRYCEKIPNKVYGYWCSKDKAFFEDEKLMMENNLK